MNENCNKTKSQFLPIILILFLFSSLYIQAQRNYKFENFGNRSILLNGNVTGSVDDLGATYYNPARLSLIDDPVFSINARIYQLTNIEFDDITFDGNDVSKTNIERLPSMVAGTFKLKFLEGHQFAYSFFSRNTSDFSMHYNIDLTINENLEMFPEIEKFISNTSFNNKLTETWWGISWAKSLNSYFSIGASLFYSHYSYRTDYNKQFSSVNENNQVASYSHTTSAQQKSDGFFAKIAAAWVLPKIDLGINIDLPYFEFKSSGKYRFEEYLTGFETIGDKFTLNDFNDINALRKYPLGISVGAGIPLKRNRLHLNMTWNSKTNKYSKLDIPPLESETEEDLPKITFNEELKSIINFGVGAEIYISPKLNFYGSFSSDYSPFVSSATFLDTSNQTGKDIDFETDYFHYGFGVNISHKWANFILGSVYSRGNSKVINPIRTPEDILETTNKTSDIHINRWRFIIGVEILFLDKTFDKHGIDKKIIIK